MGRTLKNILLVDDHLPWLSVVKASIESWEEKPFVVTAQNEIEAINIIKKNHIDLVFLDMNLNNGGSGLTIAEFASTFSPAPVLIGLSGTTDTEQVFKLAQYGCRFFLRKPSSAEEIREKALKALSSPPLIEGVIRSSVGYYSEKQLLISTEDWFQDQAKSMTSNSSAQRRLLQNATISAKRISEMPKNSFRPTMPIPSRQKK